MNHLSQNLPPRQRGTFEGAGKARCGKASRALVDGYLELVGVSEYQGVHEGRKPMQSWSLPLSAEPHHCRLLQVWKSRNFDLELRVKNIAMGPPGAGNNDWKGWTGTEARREVGRQGGNTRVRSFAPVNQDCMDLFLRQNENRTHETKCKSIPRLPSDF